MWALLRDAFVCQFTVQLTPQMDGAVQWRRPLNRPHPLFFFFFPLSNSTSPDSNGWPPCVCVCASFITTHASFLFFLSFFFFFRFSFTSCSINHSTRLSLSPLDAPLDLPFLLPSMFIERSTSGRGEKKKKMSVLHSRRTNRLRYGTFDPRGFILMVGGAMKPKCQTDVFFIFSSSSAVNVNKAINPTLSSH